jgi:hypothetical protein
MKTKKTLFLSASFLTMLFLISGCTKTTNDTSSLYIPSASDVTANATLQELQQGRELYVNYCNRCHGLYTPENYTPTQWKSILSNMGPRTTMTSSDILLVTKYVSKGKQ